MNRRFRNLTFKAKREMKKRNPVFAKSGRFSCYVCHSLLKKGKGTYKTPKLSAKRFEELVIDKVRSNILPQSSANSSWSGLPDRGPIEPSASSFASSLPMAVWQYRRMLTPLSAAMTFNRR